MFQHNPAGNYVLNQLHTPGSTYRNYKLISPNHFIPENYYTTSTQGGIKHFVS